MTNQWRYHKSQIRTPTHSSSSSLPCRTPSSKEPASWLSHHGATKRHPPPSMASPSAVCYSNNQCTGRRSTECQSPTITTALLRAPSTLSLTTKIAGNLRLSFSVKPFPVL
ncbi:hypothetical protein U1Q18_028165 [Sarracenia purpurea var. burkii]